MNITLIWILALIGLAMWGSALYGLGWYNSKKEARARQMKLSTAVENYLTSIETHYQKVCVNLQAMVNTTLNEYVAAATPVYQREIVNLMRQLRDELEDQTEAFRKANPLTRETQLTSNPLSKEDSPDATATHV